MNLEELRKYAGADRPKTVREWYGNLADDERDVVAGVILSQPARVAVKALREHAGFPFRLTALKDLRAELRENV